MDPEAAASVMKMEVPLVFVPYEAARQVELGETDLEAIATTGPASGSATDRARAWLEFWKTEVGRRGFCPFDLIAAVFMRERRKDRRLQERRSRMRLRKTAHTSRPWRVHELTEDFNLEDVWELPTPGGPDDLARLVQQFASRSKDPVVVRALFAIRWKLGELFGWDKPDFGVGERVRSLRERLPADLLEAPRGPDLRAVPGRAATDGSPIFNSVYQTHDEWMAELSNKTVHAVMHIGWVPDDSGSGYHAQLAVLVKPNGWFGKAYLGAIKPFRYALVYPLLLRSIGRHWRMQAAA